MHEVQRLARRRVGELVRRVQTPANLAENVGHDVDRQNLERRLRLLRICQLAKHARERLALDVLHREVQLAVGLAVVVRRDDVRMLQHRDELGFAEEHVDAAPIARGIRKQALQRDDALDVLGRIARGVATQLLQRRFDGAHAAFAEHEERSVSPSYGLARGHAVSVSDPAWSDHCYAHRHTRVESRRFAKLGALSLNVVRFTLVGFMFGCAAVGAVNACLPELEALPVVPAEGGSPTEVTGCGDGIIATNDDGGDAGESCDPGSGAANGCNKDCTISCAGVVGPSGHCYFLADPSDYEQALKNCNTVGGHVVTIGSENEAALVARVADGGTYRVGLLLDDNLSIVAYKTPLFVEEPGWPGTRTSCPGCLAFGANDAGEFAPLVPDSGTDHRCLVAGPDGQWLQVACKDSDAGVATICEREPVGQRSQSCGGPLCTTLPSTAGKKRYVVSISPATATQADEFCRSYPGGSLVVFDSREEREELAREIRQLVPASQQNPVLTAWIGLAKTDDRWQWADGVDSLDGGRPAPWANTQPAPTGKGRAYMRLDVTAFDTQLAIAGDDDSASRLFICQRGL